jgi:hypothetical protein
MWIVFTAVVSFIAGAAFMIGLLVFAVADRSGGKPLHDVL